MDERQTGPRVTASSHDNSTVRAIVEAGMFEISTHDDSKLDLAVKASLKDDTTLNSVEIESNETLIDWQKWGVIVGILGIIASTLVAVF